MPRPHIHARTRKNTYTHTRTHTRTHKQTIVSTCLLASQQINLLTYPPAKCLPASKILACPPRLWRGGQVSGQVGEQACSPSPLMPPPPPPPSSPPPATACPVPEPIGPSVGPHCLLALSCDDEQADSRCFDKPLGRTYRSALSPLRSLTLSRSDLTEVVVGFVGSNTQNRSLQHTPPAGTRRRRRRYEHASPWARRSRAGPLDNGAGPSLRLSVPWSLLPSLSGHGLLPSIPSRRRRQITTPTVRRS